jgi:hypothetical protein
MSFNPETFLDATFTESTASTLAPVPQGEYLATIKSITPKGGEKEGRPWAKLDVAFVIEDPIVVEELGRTPTVFYSVFLDLDANGNIDQKKNVNFGRLREAVDLNKKGEAFNIGMMVGKQARVKVDHRIWNEQVQAEVKAVTKPY